MLVPKLPLNLTAAFILKFWPLDIRTNFTTEKFIMVKKSNRVMTKVRIFKFKKTIGKHEKYFKSKNDLRYIGALNQNLWAFQFFIWIPKLKWWEVSLKLFMSIYFWAWNQRFRHRLPPISNYQARKSTYHIATIRNNIRLYQLLQEGKRSRNRGSSSFFVSAISAHRTLWSQISILEKFNSKLVLSKFS